MEDQRGNKNYLNLDLVNVMYGVVASYGFYFIDRATTVSDYLTFIFAYIILFMDWIYSHHTYKDQEYKKSYLVLDLTTLFLFSRLLATSTVDQGSFFVWLSLIFVFYFIWDYVLLKDRVSSGFSWISCLASDFAGAAVFFILGLVLKSQTFLVDNIFISIAAVIIYFVITVAWFRKPARPAQVQS